MIPTDEWVMLSGIQHYVFCPRQWGLIYMEQLWAENALTTSGSIFHEKVDDPFSRMFNKGRLTLHRVALASAELGVYGFSDAVEMLPAADGGITLADRPGRWIPYPVEFKHGNRKSDLSDTLQLTAQAMCLEEMHGIALSEGSIFYGRTRRRVPVRITDELRELTKATFAEMRKAMKSGKLPEATPDRKCKRCSLIDLCQPSKGHDNDVAKYLKNYFL